MRQLVLNENQTVAFDLPIFQEQINGETIQTVNARDLHSELGSKRQFTNWIDERIEKYGFVEGEDFLTNLLKTSTGGRPTKEYHVSFDMAKELAMVEANDKGQQLRRYFIQKEKESRLLASAGNNFIAPVLQDCVSIAQIFGLSGNQALLSASRGVEKLTGCNPATLLGVELVSERKEKTYTVTELGRLFMGGLSAQKVNKQLAAAGLQLKNGQHWELTEAGQGHAELLDTGKSHSNGTPVKQIKWFGSVAESLNELA